jgi:hypothetical protein
MFSLRTWNGIVMYAIDMFFESDQYLVSDLDSLDAQSVVY